MKFSLGCWCLAIALFFTGIAPAAAANTPAALDALVEEALANNPDLQAARARWEMNTEKISQLEALDDPVAGIVFNNFPVDSLAADETPMTGRIFRVSQKFPFPGKLALRGEIAGKQAEWYRAAYDDARLQLGRMVREGWYNLYYYNRGIEVTEKNMTLLDDFTRLTETRYEVGQGLQQDVLKAQVERSKLMDRLFTLRQQRRTALENLNRLLARPTGSPLETPTKMETPPVTLSLDALLEQSRSRRPLYAAYESLVERYRVEKQLAKRNFYPDFNVGAAYTFREKNRNDDGTDFVGLEFSMNLPVYRQKRHAAVAEAESGVRMALRQYDDFRNTVEFNIADGYAQMEKNRDLLRLYESGIVPQAGQSYQASVSAYQVGSVDFLSLLDSLMTLYRYNLEYYRVQADYQKSLARLEAESGVEIAGPSADSNPVNP
jgi:outer membrane protein TolC